MLGRFGKDAGSLLGVEIAHDSIRMLQVQRRQGRYQALAWAQEALDVPLHADWSKDYQPLIKALRSAYLRSGCKRQQVAVALPGAEVICKVCSLPAGLTAAQLEERLLADAERLFPFPLEDLAMDFQVMGASPQAEGHVDVLVAACRQRSLELLEQVFEEAGLQAVAVEVDSIALRRVLPAGKHALLRIESASAALHTWSDTGLPQRQEVRFAPSEPCETRLERAVQLFRGVTPQGLMVATQPTESGWIDGLQQRLGIPCDQFRALHGVRADVKELSLLASSMALACGLALGGGQ
ncbi:type IV pilus biogenesis protein PilM [Pseudomonas urmiensis]|uniref:type IV pilus biogenesis protein PilM n=1 Tax=Pseudomonas urmiensis TaxID=2745493 RepID=UPI0034D3CC3A